MKHLLRPCLVFVAFFSSYAVYCQQDGPAPKELIVSVKDAGGKALASATVELMQNDKLLKIALTDAKGIARFPAAPAQDFSLKLTHIGYEPVTLALTAGTNNASLVTKASGTTLNAVTVASRRPFIQHAQGKVLVNVDASVTNAGTTVLEVLEKSPGIIIDRNGGISMQGKTGVLVLVDDKPTYLPASELSIMLSSMSSTQVEQIELITNPSAKYDASGNAGIINIKTKKTKQKGFNGNFTIAASHGFYPKSNNSLLLNFKSGKWSSFLSYSFNYNDYLSDIYALRNYYSNAGILESRLDQPTRYRGESFNNTIRTGLDFFASPSTTIGVMASGVIINRHGNGYSYATWLDQSGAVDSSIRTENGSDYNFRNLGLNLNLKHTINKKQQLNVDVDHLDYSIRNEMSFTNYFQSQGGYIESTRGVIPSDIAISSVKLDHALSLKNGKLETGWKSSHVNTDNLADYEIYDAGNWVIDYGKTNHFKYKENIHAAYSSIEQKWKRVSMQAGLRYEYTSYTGNQLGNAVSSDSVFSKHYHGFFPNGYISYTIDSSNTITLSGGRRIDRPAFRNLNPFVNIINKYTHEKGNPFVLPQYTWNIEVAHQYKQALTTTLSYSIVKNYFSQLFLTEPEVLVYTQGNVGRMHNLALSFAFQQEVNKWWSFTGQLMGNYKKLDGYLGIDYSSSIKQFNFSMNNQLKLSKKYTAEVSGFYTGRARNDLQEVLYPTGQLSAGISRPVMKNKGTLKLAVRDILYTQAMEGFTDFQNATEYFIIKRDSRVVNLAFTYRFGKAYKTTRRTTGSATDEMERVGSGN